MSTIDRVEPGKLYRNVVSVSVYEVCPSEQRLGVTPVHTISLLLASQTYMVIECREFTEPLWHMSYLDLKIVSRGCFGWIRVSKSHLRKVS